MTEFRYDTQLLIEGHDLDEDAINDYFLDNDTMRLCNTNILPNIFQ